MLAALPTRGFWTPEHRSLSGKTWLPAPNTIAPQVFGPAERHAVEARGTAVDRDVNGARQGGWRRRGGR